MPTGCSRDASQAALGRTPCPAGSEPPSLVEASSLAVSGAHLARIHHVGSFRWLPHQELTSPLVGTAGPRAWGGKRGSPGPAPSAPPAGGRRGDVPHEQQQVEVGCREPSPVHSPPEVTRRDEGGSALHMAKAQTGVTTGRWRKTRGSSRALRGAFPPTRIPCRENLPAAGAITLSKVQGMK